MSTYNELEFINTDIIDNDGSAPLLQQGTEREIPREDFDNLDIHIPYPDDGIFSFDPPPLYALLPSILQSWQSPNLTVPANSMTCGMPILETSPTVDTSVDNSYGSFDPDLIANTGVHLYQPGQGISPAGTQITDQSNSLTYSDINSPFASSSSPSEMSMAEEKVFSDSEYQHDDISSPSLSVGSCSSFSPISDARRFASTRASHSDGAYRLPTKIASTALPPVKFSLKASRANKRKVNVSELEELSLCYRGGEDGGVESSDEDEYRPESGDDSDLDARSRRSVASSKRPYHRVAMHTDVQPGVKANRRKNNSGFMPRGPTTKKVFLKDGHTNAVGGFVCGLITQWKGKGGQYTSKGIRMPEVGEVCQMRTRNWSDMIRHQEKTFWHSPPGVCQSCQSSLNGRQDNLHRHGLAACKGPMKGKKASSKRPANKARK